jgi:hypothetical protein
MEGFVLHESGSGQGPVAGRYEDGSEILGSIKGEKFLDWLSDCWFLKKDSPPRTWSVNYDTSHPSSHSFYEGISCFKVRLTFVRLYIGIYTTLRYSCVFSFSWITLLG